jgi:hypothetical protein
MAWPNKVENSALRFTVKVSATGRARTTGVIRLEDDSGRRILVAEPGGTQASCANVDGDGVAGLVRLSAVFRDVETGTLFDVVLVPTGPDIGVSGVHELILQVGAEAPTTGAGFVRVQPFRRPRRRRNRR